jgi:methionine aminopeptidase type I
MIILKTPDEIALMAKASRVVAEALEVLKSAAKPGVTTDELDRLAEAEIRSRGAVPAFKGYRNYPKTLCASVNEQVVHGIPSKRVLKDGDIVGLDLGAIVGGFYGDSAVTIAVGRIDEKAATLVRVTEESLSLAIQQARVGTGCPIFLMRFSSMSKRPAIRLSPSLSDTGSGASYTRSRRYRTTGSRGRVLGSSRAWCWRLNRW